MAKKSKKEDVEEVLTKEEQSLKLVKRYMLWTLGAGAIPIPFVDFAAVTGVQIKMLKDLSEHYGIPFKEDAGKSITASLLGGISASTLKASIFGSLLKAVPVAGSILGAASMSLFSAAACYAIGKVFIQHFEAGGTFLDMDPEKVKEYFKEQFAEGKEVAQDLADKKSSK